VLLVVLGLGVAFASQDVPGLTLPDSPEAQAAMESMGMQGGSMQEESMGGSMGGESKSGGSMEGQSMGGGTTHEADGAGMQDQMKGK
jgi:hypothetical protein